MANIGTKMANIGTKWPILGPNGQYWGQMANIGANIGSKKPTFGDVTADFFLRIPIPEKTVNKLA